MERVLPPSANEIQVYGAGTVSPETIMLELHSNFTIDGFKPADGSQYQADGTFPTNHGEHYGSIPRFIGKRDPE